MPNARNQLMSLLGRERSARSEGMIAPGPMYGRPGLSTPSGDPFDPIAMGRDQNIIQDPPRGLTASAGALVAPDRSDIGQSRVTYGGPTGPSVGRSRSADVSGGQMGSLQSGGRSDVRGNEDMDPGRQFSQDRERRMPQGNRGGRGRSPGGGAGRY